jgi:hypothetical protein
LKTLAVLYRVQRATLAVWGALAGALALAGLIFPGPTAQRLLGRALPSLALLATERGDAARLGLAVIALVAALQPRPPRALVWALFAALTAASLILLVSRLIQNASPPDIAAYTKLAIMDGTAAVVLLATQEVRAYLVRAQARK